MSSAEKSDDGQIGAEGQDEIDNENKDDGHGSTNIQFVKGDYVQIIKGNIVSLFAFVTGDRYGDEVEIQYFKNSTNGKYWVLADNVYGSREVDELKKVDAHFQNNRAGAINLSLICKPSFVVYGSYSLVSLCGLHITKVCVSFDTL